MKNMDIKEVASMRLQLKLGTWLFCSVLLPSAAFAQTPSPAPAGTSVPTNVPTGTPEGVDPMPSHNSRGFPDPQTIEGQPIETRSPELASDHPVVAGETRAPYHKSVAYNVTTITDQLKAPWSLAFLPDRKMLITEKTLGAMVIVDANGAISAPLTGVPAVAAQGQVGLLDLALDPKFASNKRFFFSYSESVKVPGSPMENSNIVLARAKLDEAAGALSDVAVIFRAKPSLPRTPAANQGGKIAIGRDGNLFMTVGDRSGSPPWDMAQRLDTDLGKMIHITPDGAPAKNNPFIGKTGALPEIWSLGHRSEEGLTIDPATGQLWEVEDGPRGGDKLLHPEAGKNYGWPVYVHGIDYPGETIADGAVDAPGTEQPVYYWDPVIAPSGLAFYKGNLFPAWKHSLFVGGLRGIMLDRLEMSGGKVVAEEPLLVDQKSRIRDVRIGPEGAVYVITDAGKLLRISP
jgi:glucose/arabinose dehydrogenase